MFIEIFVLKLVYMLWLPVSYLISGHRSVYPTQLLGMTKSASLQLPLMADLGVAKSSSLC